MIKRAVVFGANGQLGVELVRELRSRGCEVGAWDRAHADITDPAAVENALANFDAEVVLNASAYNQVDVAEKEPHAAFLEDRECRRRELVGYEHFGHWRLRFQLIFACA